MSNKLFAFNVSKMIGKNDVQWKGDMAAIIAVDSSRATQFVQCTGNQNYGNQNCYIDIYGHCSRGGGAGYYLCDTSNHD